MCNAWNHSAECTCGWGGVGHLGRRSGNMHTNIVRWPTGIPPINGSIKSITIPNAQCPVCGKPVFYYCNEYGSSVFFDRPGPPWPKHPCTDRSVIARPIALSTSAINSYRGEPHWSREGWHLAGIIHVISIDKQVYEIGIRDKMSGTDHVLYATDRQVTGSIDIIKIFSKDALVFMRQIRPGAFALNTYIRQEVKLEAFSSRMTLLDQMRSVGRFQNDKQHHRNSKATIQRVINSMPAKRNTAMSEAFAKAKKNDRSN